MQKINTYIKTHFAILSITLLGIIVRLYNLTKISLWHDEAFSALLIKYSWGEMMYRIGLDVHPPLYYIVLRIWHYIFGYSLFSLRLMSVAFGVATVSLVYIFIKKYFDVKTALIAGLLVAINPFSVQYVTEARMYTMGALLAVLGAIFLAKALNLTKDYYENSNTNKKSLILNYVGFILASAAMIYTHYYLLFTVGMLGAYGLWFNIKFFKWDIKKYWLIILSGISILILFIPWLKVFLFQYKQVGSGYWIPPINVWSVPQTLYDLLIHIGQPGNIIMILVLAFVILVCVQVIKTYNQPEKYLILFTFLAPFIGSLLFALLAKLSGSNSSVYLVRYFLFASPFLLMLVSLWITKIKIYGLKTIALIVLIIINLFSIAYYWQELKVDKKPGMAALSKMLANNVQSNQKIFVASSFEFFNYKYYNKTSVKPLLYTNKNKVENLPHFAGTAILTNDDLVLDFNEAGKTGDVIWVIWTNGFGGSKPAVPKNWKQIDEQGFAEVRPYVGTWVVATQYKVE